MPDAIGPHTRLRGLAIAAAMLCLALPLAAGIIDRVVAVVGREAITASEVEQRVRLEAMLDRAPLQITAETRSEVLERLVDLRLIETEVRLAGFLRVEEAEVQQRVKELESEVYLDGLGFENALQAYGLLHQDVADFWRQYITYERFKEFRFKTGLEASEQDVAAYYQENVVPVFNEPGRGAPPPLSEIRAQIEQAVIETRANTLLEEWLKETRAQTRIVMLEEPDPAGPAGVIEVRRKPDPR
jgi:hypothetical protein